MNPIERFTRDGASKHIWGLLTLAAIVATVVAVIAGREAVDAARLRAQDRAVNQVARVLSPRLSASDLGAPLTGATEQAIRGLVARSILDDARIERLRIWRNDGELLFSSDRADRPGSSAALNDELLREAARGSTITLSDVSDTGGPDDHERSLMRTYVALGRTAVAEVDQTDEGTVALARTVWLRYQILAGALILVFLLFTILALRDPIEPINTGVPFAASSIPAGYSLIDDERLAAVKEVYRLAEERVHRLQEKLAESEEARRRLEGDIQRALSKAASGSPATRPTAPAVAPPAPAAEIAPPVTPPVAAAPTAKDVVHVPESEVVRSPLGETWAAAPAGPIARATRDQKPPPVTGRRAKPAPADAPKRETVRKLRKPKPAKVKTNAKAQPAPRVAPRAEPPIEATPQAAPAPKPEPTPAPTPAVVPAREVAAIGAKAETAPPRAIPGDEAEAHEAALETFIRLTESDRQPHLSNDVDQGAVRAALARTAARKKPGGEKLRPHDDPPEESLGGPPAGRR